MFCTFITEANGVDIRVFVVGGEAIAAMPSLEVDCTFTLASLAGDSRSTPNKRRLSFWRQSGFWTGLPKKLPAAFKVLDELVWWRYAYVQSTVRCKPRRDECMTGSAHSDRKVRKVSDACANEMLTGRVGLRWASALSGLSRATGNPSAQRLSARCYFGKTDTDVKIEEDGLDLGRFEPRERRLKCSQLGGLYRAKVCQFLAFERCCAKTSQLSVFRIATVTARGFDLK